MAVAGTSLVGHTHASDRGFEFVPVASALGLETDGVDRVPDCPCAYLFRFWLGGSWPPSRVTYCRLEAALTYVLTFTHVIYLPNIPARHDLVCIKF